MKYKVINLEEITKEVLEKMLEDAYNDGYRDAKDKYQSTTINYRGLTNINPCDVTL